LYEIKDANKSFTLKGDDLNTLWVRAVREGKEPVFIVKYANGVTATITVTKEVR
jgi:hypothetical protein